MWRFGFASLPFSLALIDKKARGSSRLPGDRFTKNDVAERFGISRTPVREALLRLQAEGLVRGHYRNGWEVVPFDLARFEALFDLRTQLETHAAVRLCQQPTSPRADRTCLPSLAAIWQVPPAEHLTDGNRVRVELSRLTTERLEQARTNLARPLSTGAPPRRRRFG